MIIDSNRCGMLVCISFVSLSSGADAGIHTGLVVGYSSNVIMSH